MSVGTVYLVGAGPGDPKLITIHGLECIQKADVILYDRLVSEELLKHAKEGAELIFCGKLPGKHGEIQDDIHRTLVEKAEQGKTVTRLKGGDLFIFGRGGEEAEVLAKRDIPFEIIPGITSGIAAPAYAGIPVTYKDKAMSFAIVTGHGREEKGQDTLNWEALAKGIDTIAFYMGVGNLPHIVYKLTEHGRNKETPVAIIHKGTTQEQRTVVGTLATIEEMAKVENVKHPSMIIVGEVVDIREKIQWFNEKGEKTTYDNTI
ncbi:uroporphyrinogen-III C-methyltransferase [Priestia filamentosa]|uniref:uroporphyrinogen-III C-methyltransferase n=1 Tax=Priestia filamentosa TaxID=1402861 RepID=UPI0039829BD0